MIYFYWLLAYNVLGIIASTAVLFWSEANHESFGKNLSTSIIVAIVPFFWPIFAVWAIIVHIKENKHE